MANDNDVGHECPTYDTAGETPPRVPLLTPPQPSPTGGGGRTVEDWITVVVSRYRYLRNTQRLFPRKDSLPRGGGSGWGQQTNQRSFLNTHAKHQETEIHEPTIGYRRNAIYPLPSPPPGPTQNAVAFCVGTRPLRASPCGGGSSSARTSTFMPASAPETPPIYIHLSAQSVCKSPTTRRNP